MRVNLWCISLEFVRARPRPAVPTTGRRMSWAVHRRTILGRRRLGYVNARSEAEALAKAEAKFPGRRLIISPHARD